MLNIEFVTATNNFDLLNHQLLRSPITHRYPVAILANFPNVPAAYNAFTPRAEWVIYIHHDVYLPSDWEDKLAAVLKDARPDWAILGVAGVSLVDCLKVTHGHLLDRGRMWGQPEGLPAEVQTLDECLLIVRKAAGQLDPLPVWDERFPFDFYGADMCLELRENFEHTYLPWKSVAVDLFCEHNSLRTFGGRTEGFYDAEKQFAQKWYHRLPVVTTCAYIKKPD